ncbi:MAG: hypothetical protein EBY40_02460, partial [Marivivens sp.]|nr:hypothetical protein [Marivivens sp.]
MSAMSDASPPEQDIDAILFDDSPPVTCRTLSVSKRAEGLSTCAKPNRRIRAFAPASLPAREAVWDTSSNVAINLTMQRRGLPVAYVVTVGNQAQMGMADIGAALLCDPRVTALGLHIEGVNDLRAYEALADTAKRLGKPVVVMKVGASDQAQQATVSHTASLAGSDAGAKTHHI